MDHRTSLKREDGSPKAIRERLLKTARFLGIPMNLVTPLVSQFAMQVGASGEEWTISRFKAIRVSFIQMYAGKNKDDVRVSWVAGGEHTLYAGHLSALETWAGDSTKRQAKFLQLLRMYTVLKSDKATPTQVNKFVRSVRAEPVPVDTYKDIVQIGISRLIGVLSRLPDHPNFLDNLNLELPDPLITYHASEGKRAPTLDGKSTNDDGYLLQGLELMTNTVKMRTYTSRYPEVWKAISKGLGTDFSYDLSNLDGWKPPIPLTGGKIAFLQEPGYKLRAIANPHRIWQHILAPLFGQLDKILSVLPFDYTHSQDLALPVVQSWLSQGEIVNSIDLSDATNNFPLGPQLMIQNQLFGANYATDLFYTISRAEWFLPSGDKISWTKGQPLGLYPSFSSFALSHSVVVLGVMTQNEYVSSTNSGNWPFTVLGDDIAIRGVELANRYRVALAGMQVPVAEAKTISSNKLSEFAGKIIFPTFFLSQVKFKESSDDNFLDLVRFFGLGYLKALRMRQYRVAEKLIEVPEMFGGLGFNPYNKPLEQRIAENLWIFKDEVSQPYLMDLYSMFNNRLYSESSVIPNFEELSEIYELSSQKVHRLVRTYLGKSLVPLSKILGLNLSEVSDVDLLPYVTRPSSKSSALEMWERKIAAI